MTLRNLEIFLAVVDCGSMHAAAAELYISQPSVSGAVAELEREYSTLLFERLGRKLYLTPAGSTLADYARHLLKLSDEMSGAMHHASDGEELRIGATVTVGTCVLCNLLAKLPGATPKVLVNNTEMIEQQLLKSVLDIGIIEGTVTSPDLVVRPVMQDEMVLICAPEHPFAANTELPVAKLAGEPMIFREAGSGSRKLCEAAFALAAVSVKTVWECNNTEAILNAVQHGFGSSVISARLAAPAVAAGRVAAVRLTGCNLMREFSLVWHKDKYIGKRLARFITLCEEG